MCRVKISAVFGLALLSAYHVSGQGKWRYASTGLDLESFSTRLPISVQHVEFSRADWCCSYGCTINTTSPTRATFLCTTAGYHRIGPVQTGQAENEDMRYIKVDHDPFCYEWYIVYSEKVNNTTQDMQVRAWIVDPNHLSPAERNGSALEPSEFSKQLSGTLQRLGQRPLLTATTGLRFVKQALTVLVESFDNSFGYWDFLVHPVERRQSVLWIDSKPVALYNCFVRGRKIQLMTPHFQLPTEPKGHEVPLKAWRKHPLIIQASCTPHVAVYLSRSFLLTQDNFVTSRELTAVNSSILQETGAAAAAVDIVFTAQGLLVLVGSGKLLLYNGTADVFTESQGVSHVNLTGLSAPTQCFEGRNTKSIPNTVITWSSQTAGEELFLSTDGGLSFSQLSIQTQSFTRIANWSVEHACVHSLFPSVTVLAAAEEMPGKGKQRLLLQYSVVEATWTEVPVQLSNFTEECPVAFQFMPTSSQAMLLWNCKIIAYADTNNIVKGLVIRKGSSYLPFRAEGNETIISVVSGGVSEFVVLLSTNRMFYGRADVEHVVEVLPGERSDAQMTAMFDLTGRLLVITNRSCGLQQRIFPLKNEVLNALYPDTLCPFIKLKTPDAAELNFLDKEEEFSIWTVLIYPAEVHNDMLFQISGHELLDIQTVSHQEYSPGMVNLNKTFIFKHRSKNQTELDERPYKPGVVSVYLYPQASGLSCDVPSHLLLHIQVGCPTTRHIRVRTCDHYSKTGQNQVTVGVAGTCALSTQVRQAVQLVLDMYDGSRFLREVSSDYIVFETSDRKDYGYTATMGEVGCLREAQTWNNMMEAAENSSGTIDTVWGQHNYKSCFVKNDEEVAVFDASQPYEILNSSAVSQLVFHGTGHFQFALKVVDRRLSFCPLELVFSVEVGAEAEDGPYLPQLLSISVVLLGSAGLLILSYAHYRKQTLEMHRQDNLELQRLQELKSIVTHLKTAHDTEVVSRRPTGHSVRRFTGTAQMLSDKLPTLARSKESTLVETPEPSNTSLRLRKSVLPTASPQNRHHK